MLLELCSSVGKEFSQISQVTTLVLLLSHMGQGIEILMSKLRQEAP